MQKPSEENSLNQQADVSITSLSIDNQSISLLPNDVKSRKLSVEIIELDDDDDDDEFRYGNSNSLHKEVKSFASSHEKRLHTRKALHLRKRSSHETGRDKSGDFSERSKNQRRRHTRKALHLSKWSADETGSDNWSDDLNERSKNQRLQKRKAIQLRKMSSDETGSDNWSDDFSEHSKNQRRLQKRKAIQLRKMSSDETGSDNWSDDFSEHSKNQRRLQKRKALHLSKWSADETGSDKSDDFSKHSENRRRLHTRKALHLRKRSLHENGSDKSDAIISEHPKNPKKISKKYIDYINRCLLQSPRRRVLYPKEFRSDRKYTKDRTFFRHLSPEHRFEIGDGKKRKYQRLLKESDSADKIKNKYESEISVLDLNSNSNTSMGTSDDEYLSDTIKHPSHKKLPKIADERRRNLKRSLKKVDSKEKRRNSDKTKTSVMDRNTGLNTSLKSDDDEYSSDTLCRPPSPKRWIEIANERKKNKGRLFIKTDKKDVRKNVIDPSTSIETIDGKVSSDTSRDLSKIVNHPVRAAVAPTRSEISNFDNDKLNELFELWRVNQFMNQVTEERWQNLRIDKIATLTSSVTRDATNAVLYNHTVQPQSHSYTALPYEFTPAPEILSKVEKSDPVSPYMNGSYPVVAMSTGAVTTKHLVEPTNAAVITTTILDTSCTASTVNTIVKIVLSSSLPVASLQQQKDQESLSSAKKDLKSKPVVESIPEEKRNVLSSPLPVASLTQESLSFSKKDFNSKPVVESAPEEKRNDLSSPLSVASLTQQKDQESLSFSKKDLNSKPVVESAPEEKRNVLSSSLSVESLQQQKYQETLSFAKKDLNSKPIVESIPEENRNVVLSSSLSVESLQQQTDQESPFFEKKDLNSKLVESIPQGKRNILETLKEKKKEMQKVHCKLLSALSDMEIMKKLFNEAFREKPYDLGKKIYSKCKNILSLSGDLLEHLQKQAKLANEDFRKFKETLPTAIQAEVSNNEAEQSNKDQGYKVNNPDKIYSLSHSCDNICNAQFKCIAEMMNENSENKECMSLSDNEWANINKESNPAESTVCYEKGSEFIQLRFFCSLCNEILLDKSSAEQHGKKQSHVTNYNIFTENNPLYEKKCIVKRCIEEYNANKKSKEVEKNK